MRKKTLRKVLESVLLIAIVIISMLVFVFKDSIQKIEYWGYGGIFCLCFLSNFSVFLPAPSLMVIVSFSQVMPPFAVATVGAVGTTLGEFSGYICGRAGQNLSSKFAVFIEKISKKIHRVSILVFILALLPLPLFDFAGVYAGGCKMPSWKFGLCCFLGKWMKMFFYAAIMSSILH